MHAPPYFGSLGIAELRTASTTYLDHAYPKASLPESIARRLLWREADVADLIGGPPFEKSQRGDKPPIFALRLGNHVYPHMKLQIQPWPTARGFMLSVNTHDHLLLTYRSDDEAAEIAALRRENQRIKELIETGWENVGLPTFLSYLRGCVEAEIDGVVNAHGLNQLTGESLP